MMNYKKVIALMAAALCVCAASAEVNIGVAIPVKGEISGKACNVMEQRLKRAMSPMGVSSTQWGDFYAVPTLNILNEEIAETGMKKIFRISVDLTVAVKQLANDAQYGADTWELKGVGDNREKAIIAALSSWRGGPRFEQLINQSKERIEKYYVENREAMISKAQQCAKNGDHDQALAILSTYPTNLEGSDVVMKHIEDVFRSAMRKDCAATVGQARAAIATEDYTLAADYLSQLDEDSPCASEVKALNAQIFSRIKADEREQYEREQAQLDRQERQHNAELAHQRAVQRESNKARQAELNAQTSMHNARMRAVASVAKAYYSRSQPTYHIHYRVY